MTETAPKVIVIPAKQETPQEQVQKKHLRVAAYCRVSTNSKEQLTSYENQLAHYTEKIMNDPNWTMVKVFADEGKTGTSTCKRKEFLQMIRMCRQGKIDMILAKSVSRFARNTVDTLNYTRELRELGIPVIFEEQNINSIYPESEFLIAIHGAFAQSESESTSSRVRWGQRQSMKSGRVTMQYKWMLGYEKGPDGKPLINEEQAETVRFIYQRYLAGDTLRAIKSKLEAQGALNAIGKQEWTIKNLLSILTNEKYCGDALLQKTFIQDCISKKVIQNNGQLPKYLVQDHHEGIVSRDVFYAAQLEIARRRAQTGGYQQERAHRTEQVQREVHPDKSHVLRPLRDRLSPVRMEQGRGQAGCVAVREPPGLWGKILQALGNTGGKAAPAGDPERHQPRDGQP